MKLLDKILTEDINKRKWTAIAITIITSGLLTLLGIYGIEEYGIALFILTPFYIGFTSTALLGYKKTITKKQAITISFVTLGIFACSLLLFAIEGLICIAMAAPFALFLTWLGAIACFSLLNQKPENAPKIMFLLLGIIPGTAKIESNFPPQLSSVVTSVDIDAKPYIIWKNVVAFPQLKEPTEFLFKTGIAYPINAEIKGEGVGAVRHCNFTTGSFVEPITVWNEPKLLQFIVEEQPAPMKELSFWDIDAPHLHDYFVSKKGQFKLIPLANGKTRLEGTTWYYHNIKPAFYWKIWSNYIIHKIHQRVLNHIKVNAETQSEISK